MKIEFLQDTTEEEVKLLVVSAEYAGEAKRITEELNRLYGDSIQAYLDNERIRIPCAEILRIFAQGKRVFCQTENGIFTLHARLYETEEQLDPTLFVRISKCELVNKQKILRLDLSLTGTIGIRLEGNVKTYTSRRYMPKIREIFSEQEKKGDCQ